MTYTRAARNLICIIPQSAQVEFGRMYASGNIVQLRNFIETVTAGTVALGATALSIGLLMSPILIPIWTHGNVSGPWDLLIVLTVVCIVGTYFDPLLISSIAMNQMTFVSLSYAIGLAIGIGCGLFLLPSIGLATFAGICLLPPELAGSFAGRRSVEKMVGRMDFARGALFLVQSTIPSILRR
jgi:O-antigen/teichoic acid export membrane protein